MKNLSNMAKSNIFLALSLAFALSTIWVTFVFQTSLWGIFLAVAYYYWGKDKGIQEAKRKHNIELFGPARMW